MTKEEQSKLRSNIEKIEAYIKAEIIPRLNGTRARVDFGDMQTYVGEPHREREYHLSVSPQGVSGWTGNLGLTMLPEDDAFLLDFPLRQAVPGEPEQPASVPLLSSSAAHSVYEGMTDEDVVSLCRTGDSVAVEYLLNKYKNFVRSKARSYFLIGADHEDIVQEGMIGLYKAIRDFRPEKLASFRAFAELCITRQIITAIKTATRQKHIPLNSYVSLNKPLYDEESDRTLLDVCAEGHSSNPEELIISQEDLRGIHQRIDEVLSDLEQEVLAAYLDGKSYQEIADNLGRHVKSIDNALQRVKRKLERYLEDMEAQNND